MTIRCRQSLTQYVFTARRYASVIPYLCLSVSVYHKSKLLDVSSRFLDISKKIRVLTSGTLPQTLYWEKISPWQIDHVVTLTTIAAPFAWQSILYTRGARRLLHFRQSYCSNSITLTCCGFVVQLVPQLYSSWQDFDWHRASHGWLSSRVVSMLDSGAVGPGFISQPRRCRVTVLGKLFTPVVPLFTKQPS